MLKQKTRQLAFGLIELSIVIMVISVTMAIFLSTQSSNFVINNSAKGQDKMNKIYQALQNYVAKNNRLPCPASLAVSKKDASYGSEVPCVAASGIYVSDRLVYGMVPVKSLGIDVNSAEDGFGNKFGYVVDSFFTTATKPSKFVNPNQGIIVIKNYLQSSLNTEEPNAIFAIISTGKNQKSAVSSTSSAPAPISPTETSTNIGDVDELKNVGSILFDGTLISSSTRNASSFDDVVFYKNKQNFLSDAKLQFSMGDTNTTGFAKATSGTCTISGVAGFNDKTGLVATSTPIALTLPCQAGFVASTSPAPSYTCSAASGSSTSASLSGSCTPITCTASGTGYVGKTGLAYALSSSFLCDPGYTGTINYSCLATGAATITGGSCAITTCSITSVTGTLTEGFNNKTGLAYKTTATALSSPCKAGYFASTSPAPSYTCTTSGAAVLTGSCDIPTCTITSVLGFNDKTGLSYATAATTIPSPCASGYLPSTPAPSYTCTTSGPATISGACAKCVGGTTTSSGTTTIHVFTSSGTFQCAEAKTIKLLVVGGGGAGSNRINGGGGGGGGGVVNHPGLNVSASTSYNITVGGGGIQSYNTTGNSGSDSSFNDIIVAKGGGGGGASSNYSGPSNGGSGGGRGRDSGSVSGGAATANTTGGGTGYGNSGGGSGSGWNGAGGGGGAKGVGGSGSGLTASGPSSERPGNGGAGFQSSISGSTAYYGAGGGGCNYGSGVIGYGGSSGLIGAGGNGATLNAAAGSTNGVFTSATNATSGQNGYGSGGGGGCASQINDSNGNPYPGKLAGSGGSGVVIISY